MSEGNAGTTTAPSRPAGRNGWRGNAERQPPRHRWQQLAAGGALLGGRMSRAVRAGLFFAAACILLLVLVTYLLYAPAKTPLLAVVATRHEWPLPVNAFAREDFEALATQLDRQNLAVTELSDEWRSPKRALEALAARLKARGIRSSRSAAVILYLSMPGAVDGEGRLYLIPEGADPHDAASWLPLADVLRTIREAELPAGMTKLVVLDATRQVVNWNTGTAYSAFAEGLPREVAEASVPNLAVLSSAGPGQSAYASPRLRASVFGHFFCRGLAGDADAEGNGDSRVSLQELTGYLAREVDGWCQRHLGTSQTPTLTPAEGNATVAWSVNRRTRRAIATGQQTSEPAAPAVPTEQLAARWADLDVLRAGRPWRFDPLAWRALEHDLLRLEQLSAGGTAYASEAARLAADLERRLGRARQRLETARASRSLPAYAAVLNGSPLPELRAHSLPLAALFGTLEPDVVRGLAASLDRLQEQPTAGELDATLVALRGASLPMVIDEANYLAMWQRLAVPQAWSDAQGPSAVLEAHRLAEQLATPQSPDELPGDERAHAWTRARLAAPDKERRALEDAALVGPAAAGGSLASAEALVDELAVLAQDDPVVAAFQMRDDLYAQLPYIAAWLCQPRGDARDQQAADSALRQTLVPLLSEARRLEQVLARPDALPEGAELTWQGEALRTSIAARWQTLLKLWDDEIARLAAASEEATSIAEIDAVLAAPLLRSDARQRLHRKRQEIDSRLAQQFDAPEAEAGPPTPRAARPLAETVLALADEHPLAMLLAGVPVSTLPSGNAPRDSASAKERQAGSSDESSLALARQSDVLRHKLRQLSQADLTQPDLAARPALGQKPAPAGLASLCRAESLVRAASAVWFSPPQVDPVAALRRADLQQLLLWRAGRALEDFYGSGRDEPFFATAASDYLAGTKALGPLAPAAASQAESLAALLAERRVAAEDALSMSAADLLLVDQSPSLSSTLVVRAKLPEGVASLPEATGAVLLADSTGRLGSGAHAVALPQANVAPGQVLLEELATFDTASLRGRDPFLQAVVSVRGNDFTAPVLLTAPGGAHVEFETPRYGPPTVTVVGYEQKRASVVFILDCSRSMRDPTVVERPDGNEATRMEVAKGALRTLLGELAERGNASVGVRFFGHRVGWSTVEAGKLMRQTEYSDDIPTTLRPDGDVEQVLKLGRFDSIAAGIVVDKLDKVKGWGETPLYLAITEALADFEAADDTEQSIVVITDGQNYQFNPTNETRRSLNDVLSSLNRRRVPIHIVGFDLPAGEAETARQEFTTIAERTGGSFTSASGATSLLATLQSLLQPGEFRVSSSAGQALGQAELGQMVTIEGHAGRERYEVAYDAARAGVNLAGGEAVELGYVRAGRRLEVAPYKWDDPRFPLVEAEGEAPTDLVAAMHRSIRVERAVKFPISIQHGDRRFVPRPVESWIEVEPLGRGLEESARATFIYYDPVFLPHTSVPLVELPAYGWPAGAERAAISLWIKPQTTPVSHQEPLAAVADRVPEGADGFEIPGIAGVTYQARTVHAGGEELAVGVVERHDERSLGVGSLKVALVPAPDHVVHRFDPQNRLVLHTFSYRQAPPDLRDRIALQFTTRQAAQQGTLRLQSTVEVDVSDRSELLEVTPTAAR